MAKKKNRKSTPIPEKPQPHPDTTNPDNTETTEQDETAEEIAEPEMTEEQPPDHPPDDLIQSLERKLETIQRKYEERVISDELRKAYLDQGGQPSAADTAVLAIRAGAGKTVKLDDQGEIAFANPDGEPLCDDDGVRYLPDTYVRRWLAANPIFLQPEARRGSGSAPSESSEPSAEEIHRAIRSARSADDILKLAASLGLK